MARGHLLSRSAASPATTSSNESHGPSRIWTPLRENHFEPPLLSSKERSYLVRKACEAAQELVERARSAGGPIAWRHIEKNNGVQIYVGSPRSTAAVSAHSSTTMCGVTCVPGTVKEVASIFELSSTRQMKEFARAHREWFYDGIVLHTLAPRTKEKPLHQVTAKWMVMQMPSGLPHRDFCYLECQDKFIDAKGRKGWVLGQHSIKLPGCDDLKREFGLIRGSLYHSGFVIVESEERPGHVDVIYLVQLNLKDHTPVPLQLLQARVLFVAQVRNILRSKRLNEQRYLSDLELVPRKYRARCAVCQDSFSLLLLRKLNCRKCGEVVCAACSKEFPIENRTFSATNGRDGVRKLRICLHCFQLITNAPKPASALAEPAHSSIMTMSFLGYHDDDRRAAHMTMRDKDYRNQNEEPAPKIFLQSMHREKSSRRRMSSTSPIPGHGADSSSSSRHRGRGKPDAELYRRSHRYHEEQHDYERSFHRASHRTRPSEFRPSQSLSLDDPFAKEEGRYTLQMPGPPAVAPPASIFDRPATGATRRHPPELFRSRSSDMLVGASSRTTSNFNRLQKLSSRERLEKLQRENNMMSRSSMDLRIPDSYMPTLHHASHEKHEFDIPPPMYHAPSSDFGAYSVTLDDPVPDFSTYDSTPDDMDGPPPLDMSALTTSASAIPIELNRMERSANMPREHEEELLRHREREIEQRRESIRSDSSAFSIDIDSYDEPQKFAMIPSIPEQMKSRGEPYYETSSEDMMPNSGAFNKNYKKTSIHDAADDSEGSMGASDDDEESWASDKFTGSPRRRPIDENAAETKTLGFAETLKFPFRSALRATRTMRERPSIVKSSSDTLVRNVARAETEISRQVETFTSKKTKESETDFIDPKDQQRELKVEEDLTDYELHQESEAQNTVDEKRHDGVEAANEDSRHGCYDQAEDGKAIVDHEKRLSELDATPGDDITTAFSKTNDAYVPFDRPETSLDVDGSKMVLLDSDMRRDCSLENAISLDQIDLKEHQTLPVTDIQIESREMTSPPLEPATTTEDYCASLGSINEDDTGDDEHEDKTAFTPSKLESAMFSADSERIQSSENDMSESQLPASTRISSYSARGSSICSMGLDQITPPATPTSESSVVNNAPLAFSPDRTEQPQKTQQNVLTEEPQFNTSMLSTQSQSTVAFHPDFSESVNAHQEQKPLSGSACGVVDGLSPPL